MKKLKFIGFIFLAISTVNINADEIIRIYIDEQELCCEENAFWIHIGGNEWIHTDTVHRDNTGLFTHECNIARHAFTGKDTPKPDNKKHGYEKMWKCPYCHKYWPIGKACENGDCASRYK